MGSDRNYRQFDQIQSFLTSASLFVGNSILADFLTKAQSLRTGFFIASKVGWSM
ncbi:Uncharacterised protein [Mannheimia haemolytica]|uniref:Uncharacterized protein n=1 Tax=Mannheimia haemolytica TaxID=75985 RepID=A0A378N0U0_MANHA|nr:Uncharacterised protein [Mannheimia haemolytica]